MRYHWYIGNSDKGTINEKIIFVAPVLNTVLDILQKLESNVCFSFIPFTQFPESGQGLVL